MANDLAYVNGRITPAAEAVVPVLDRGFLLGDACYEVVRVYAGVPWHLEEHLERLERSAAGLKMAKVPAREVLARVGLELFASSGHSDGRIYYQLTRGVGRTRSEAPTPDLEPTLVVMAESIHSPSEAMYASGVKAITVPEARWERSDYKTTNLMPRILVRMEAQAQGAYEALWRDAHGRIREGTVTNFFGVKDGVLVTQALEPGVVAGVTRREVLAVARELAIPVSESAIGVAELGTLTEAFVTGTTPEVLAVVQIDGVRIGQGQPGPITKRLHAGYRERVQRWVERHGGAKS
jgi:D-alanine transaminase